MPDAGYSLKECEFCGCASGVAQLAYWQRKVTSGNQARLDKLFTSAGIPPHFQGLTLETLIALAGDDPEKAAAIAAVQEFIATGSVTDPASGKLKQGIIVSGHFGCGKTGVLTPALLNAVHNGASGLWIEMYDFIDSIQSGYGKRDEYSNRPEEKAAREDAREDADQRLAAAQKAGIILLDDFGDVERPQRETDDRRRLLYLLINHRHNAALPMLITTNCDGAQLAHQFGARTVERVMESCAWVEMGGRNLRA